MILELIIVVNGLVAVRFDRLLATICSLNFHKLKLYWFTYNC